MSKNALQVPREIGKEETVKRYQTLEEIGKDVPWALATVEKLIAHQALAGTGEGLDLSRDMLRLLVVNDREGLYR